MIFVKVDLPDGGWAEIKEVKDLRMGDKLAVKRASKIPRDGEGNAIITTAFQDEQRIALLGRIITSWSYEGWPIPSQAMSPEAAIEQLTLEAYDKLSDAVKEHLSAIEYSPSE